MAGNKLTATNTFEGGLVADLHRMASPNNTVSDALNMEIITVADDQFLFQNIKGDKHIVDLPTTLYNNTTYRFIPLGVKVSNNIAYILAGAFDSEGGFIKGMIGTYPSPDWDELNSGSGRSRLVNEFQPLHNFKELGVDTEYKSPFISTRFNFEKNRYIDIQIQGDFDSSVNIIYTDNLGNPAIINSRFKRTDSAYIVELADREGSNDSNTYSDNDWDRIALIQNTNFPVTVDSFDIIEGGYLRGGGYRYYFKYITQEGNTTEILYESPLIPISNGKLGLTKDQISDKMVRFALSNLDSSYSGIQAYFAHFDGADQAATEVYKINYVYSYGGDDSIVVTHTGLEDVTLVDAAEINVTFTPVDTAKSIAIINDRLAIAGASSSIESTDLDILENAAKSVHLWERTRLVEGDYSDPKLAADRLGYWKGEVYEFAIVFMLANKGLSPAFPVVGMDNFEGVQAGFGSSYPEYTLDETGFETGYNLINNKGVFRTSNKGSIYVPQCNKPAYRNVTYIEADTSSFADNADLKKIATGFFVVRRPRVKNVLLQGMMTPTLKLPAKPPSLAEYFNEGNPGHADFVANRRYLAKHFPTSNAVLGLNAGYQSGVRDGEPIFNDDFDVVHVPQPTQLLNVLTFDSTWVIDGSLGQNVTNTVFGETVDKKGESINKMHMAFYSCELDLNFSTIKGHLNGINPTIEIQSTLNGGSPVGYTHIGFEYDSNATPIIENAEEISMDRASWYVADSDRIRVNLLESGTSVFTDGGFTAKIDRSFGLLSELDKDTTVSDIDGASKVEFSKPYYSYVNRQNGSVIVFPCARHSPAPDHGDELFRGADFRPYSLISQSYSRYMGVELDTKDIVRPVFNYARKVTQLPSGITNGDLAVACSDNAAERYLVNIGHLANVFRSATGRWSQDDIKTIYLYDSNKAYHAVTDRYPFVDESENPVDKISIYRGDGFISQIYKRITYKNGIETAKTATTSDARTYGIGITKKRGEDVNPEENLPIFETKDEGRNLFDVGQIIELVSYSNINADIRSVERLSAEDSALYGGDRDFYPHKEKMFGDARPDATAYNHGYTGDIYPIAYHRIEENSPIFNTEFPNRILLSERNKTQSFFNSFRDLKGFNYRDYGVELGPIVKIIGVKNVLLSIHPDGVLAIGIDDRTLVSEGSDVFVNTAESLSPKAASISKIYGSQHAESIVETDTTVAGVDYASSAVWLFEGDKLSVISEFAVKTILNSYKSKISAGGLVEGDEDVVYSPRVYSTFNHSKHTLYISYVAENPDNKSQIHVGTISYNTVIGKWCSQLSEGNKFTMSIGDFEYTTGFSNTYGIWLSDALVNEDTGKPVRSKFRGIDYNHEFEITINNEPSLEKILDNIRMITNKSLPVTVIYTTNGEDNDAAIDIWGERPELKTLTQPIVTRNSSPRKSLRLGILDENAYYKNSNLYIEVGKIDSISRKNRGSKRIRDKNIRVRFVYTGNDETFIQGIISILSISHS